MKKERINGRKKIKERRIDRQTKEIRKEMRNKEG